MISSAMPISELMIKDVKTIELGASIETAARIMAEANIGSVIVVDEEKLLGILTEKDILTEVVAKNKIPSEVGVGEIMAYPLISIGPDILVSSAIEKMAKLNIRRMPVVDRGKLIGIVCSRDVFREAPKLMEISRKHRDGNFLDGDFSDVIISGKCSDCRTYSYNLIDVEGRRLCPNCRDY
ncbi:MAG: CBS domain-containing protein [Candidatus Thermoplasmatota archaeon]|nr:CBS domain-containing protein [Candidatus Thermoplasmatota archaeon]MDP7265702.1 CBS domain-containing protein [Candidatus Thermoplasmatota archaeon]